MLADASVSSAETTVAQAEGARCVTFALGQRSAIVTSNPQLTAGRSRHLQGFWAMTASPLQLPARGLSPIGIVVQPGPAMLQYTQSS